MFVNLYNRKFKVFLADVSTDMAAARKWLSRVLHNAGIAVADDMRSADCSIHILGGEDIYSDGGDGYDSPAGVQFRQAKELCGSRFKVFVWNPSGFIGDNHSYINSIRRDIVENTVYSDRPSPIIFVEDIRNIMNVKQLESRKNEPTDIFFLYNELDNDTALDIYNMLKDFQNVQRLGISISSGIDYNPYVLSQLANSKIGVVYYNYAGDWAVSFARQVWKDSGGNSSRTPLLVVGNKAHAKTEDLIVLKNILECSVCDQRRIPLDIKVFLDKKLKK